MILMIAALTSALGATYDVPGDFATLQAAHDAASTGDTIRIYGAQPGPLRIAKSISVIGGDADAAIVAIASMGATYVSTNPYRPIVYVSPGVSATVSGLTIDGLGQGNTNYDFVGLLINAATVTADSVLITGMSRTPMSTQWQGTGIKSFGASTITLTDVSIDSCQHLGALFNEGAVVDWVGGNVTGIGHTTLLPQGGIQVDRARGRISGLTISNFWKDGDASYALAWGLDILYTPGFEVRDCVIERCQSGLSIMGAQDTVVADTVCASNGQNSQFDGSVTYLNNSFTDTIGAGDVYGGYALSLYRVERASGTGNSFERNPLGLWVRADAEIVELPESRFIDNVVDGLNIATSSLIVDARRSYWGPTGPDPCPERFDCSDWRSQDGEHVPALSDAGLGVLILALVAGGWWYINSRAPKSFL